MPMALPLFDGAKTELKIAMPVVTNIAEPKPCIIRMAISIFIEKEKTARNDENVYTTRPQANIFFLP